MSDRDARWVASVALSRGLSLAPDRAEQIAAQTAPILEAFAGIAAELAADDDMYEFRRRLAREAERE